MAFTPDGMFYLSQEDYAPTMDVLGGAARGMLGLQNKEEAIQSILQGADYDTPEGRRAALEQIRVIDPEAYYKYSKMNQEYETQELGLKAKYGEPALKRAWKDIEAPKVTANWVIQNLGVYEAMEDVPEKLKNPTNEAGITNLVIWLAQNDSLLSKQQGKAAKLISAYKSMMKTEKSDYMELNKFNAPKASTSKQTRDLSSIKGRGERVVTPQDTTSGVTPQQYRIEKRMGKDVKVPYTPPVEYDVQQKLLEQEKEVLSNIPGMY